MFKQECIFLRATHFLCIVNLTDRTIIQLRFGPMVHCSKWYEDRVCIDTIIIIIIFNCVFLYNMIIEDCRSFGARHQADLD